MAPLGYTSRLPAVLVIDKATISCVVWDGNSVKQIDAYTIKGYLTIKDACHALHKKGLRQVIMVLSSDYYQTRLLEIPKVSSWNQRAVIRQEMFHGLKADEESKSIKTVAASDQLLVKQCHYSKALIDALIEDASRTSIYIRSILPAETVTTDSDNTNTPTTGWTESDITKIAQGAWHAYSCKQPVNLMTNKHRHRQTGLLHQCYLLLIGISLLISAFFACTFIKNKNTQALNNIASLRIMMNALADRNSQQAALSQDASKLDARASLYNASKVNIQNWSNLLADIQAALQCMPFSWVDTLSIDENRLHMSGQICLHPYPHASSQELQQNYDAFLSHIETQPHITRVLRAQLTAEELEIPYFECTLEIQSI